MLVLNLVMSFTGIAAFTPLSDGKTSSFNETTAVLTIVFAFILVLVGPVLALFCWFFPLYYAYRHVSPYSLLPFTSSSVALLSFRKDSSLAFMWFFFILPAQCLFWLIYALGIGGFTWCVCVCVSLSLSHFSLQQGCCIVLQ